ncbi:DNA-binding transcriptional regulator, GntR family, partial [Goodfellowiella coeruleoviolacea]|nr:DNA-binding transcriptional regulator, GntR family [Goodfellowiella coeruleoviolacea]
MPSKPDASSSKPAVSAVERAYAEIRAAIVEGRHEPGVMLSESELAAALGVSRTPVRTALARLQDEGWVTIYSKRGALVRELSAEEVRYSADVRQTLQIIGVERAGHQDRAAIRPRLEELIAKQERALADGPFDTFIDLAIRFHRVFVELSGNPLFTDFYDRLRDRQVMMLLRSASVVRKRASEVVNEHRRLMDLAAAGKVAEFAETLRRHRDEIFNPLVQDLSPAAPTSNGSDSHR